MTAVCTVRSRELSSTAWLPCRRLAMPTEKTDPVPQRLKPLRVAFEQRPCIADELVELLDWSKEEVHDLLAGQVEPSQEDMWIINGLLKHLRRTARAPARPSLAA